MLCALIGWYVEDSPCRRVGGDSSCRMGWVDTVGLGTVLTAGSSADRCRGDWACCPGQRRGREGLTHGKSAGMYVMEWTAWYKSWVAWSVLRSRSGCLRLCLRDCVIGFDTARTDGCGRPAPRRGSRGWGSSEPGYPGGHRQLGTLHPGPVIRALLECWILRMSCCLVDGQRQSSVDGQKAEAGGGRKWCGGS